MIKEPMPISNEATSIWRSTKDAALACTLTGAQITFEFRLQTKLLLSVTICHF